MTLQEFVELSKASGVRTWRTACVADAWMAIRMLCECAVSVVSVFPSAYALCMVCTQSFLPPAF